MFNYNRKKYRFLTPVKNRNDESILDRPEFMYPETKSGKHRDTDAEEMVNYLRKPRSEKGNTALFAALLAVGMTALSFWFMVASLGNPPLYVSAIAFGAMVMAVFAAVTGMLSLLERDRDPLFGILGISLAGLVLITWLFTIWMGMTA